MLPLDRRCHFMAISVGLPKPPEGDGGYVGAGNPGALVVEIRPVAVTIPRAAPVAMIVGTDLLELAEKLLRLLLRFLSHPS